jgi:Ca2+-binding RTX toxin-like protein
MLLSAGLEGGVLTIRGTRGDDEIFVGATRTSDNKIFRIEVRQSGLPTQSFDPELVDAIVVHGLGGDDSITHITSRQFEVTLQGGAGNDQIEVANPARVIGGRWGLRPRKGTADTIDPGPGRDTIIANGGRDVMVGGSLMRINANGTAVIRGSEKADSLLMDSVTRQPLVVGGVARTSILLELNGFRREFSENVVDRIVAHMGRGDDLVSLQPSSSISLLSVAARVFGGAGDDSIVGSAGDDRIDGGSGNDSIGGGSGVDTLIGAQGDDFLVGHDGDDRIFGGRGQDTLLGGFGDDTLVGGAGEDKLNGGEGINLLRPGPQ